ncbi:hypothetical protein SAMN06295885_2098 [Rathayibacter oskolensis]|uniref:Uncharacterized protein n=1 Tax=Rathayibacter oskolensis TaxID=1891671 RepID=A0A1X7NY61_9MICO|nr:CU044_5270 family protein [Rathayibacter oskolensis]SMH42913.1 hypothetical protein SAMN06295885_2098 [Rathayibacter oskolensis]
MDGLTLLRSLSGTVDDPDEAVLARGRAALFERIQGETVAPPRPAVLPRRLVLAAVGVGAIATVLVSVNVLGPGSGGASSAAAAVLHEAAARAIETTDPVLGPGQFLMVSTAAVSPVSSDTAASYLVLTRDQLYIPADTADEWVWVRPAEELYETFSPESEQAAAADFALRAAEGRDGTELLRAAGGRFYGGDQLSQMTEFTGLPRDPDELLERIYTLIGSTGSSREGEALEFIATALRSGAVPAELRAALFDAAAEIPGVTITDQQATFEGATGVAIGRWESRTGTRQEILIDPDTGRLIGERRVLVDPGYGLPAGATLSTTSVTTRVVDEAPAGGTPDGALEGCTVFGNGQFQC